MQQFEQYLEKGKEVLKILINNGCEAYLIGGAVCNTILQIPFDEIDVTTNATPDMVKGIFSQAKVEDETDGSVRLFYSGYQFVISTFRIEDKHRDNRRPSKIHYSKNLHDELACRDFSINAIAMSYGGKLTDAYRGFQDIQKKRIKTIGNPRVRFSEEPLRLLIAIRLVSELGFKIERKTLKALRVRSKLINNLKTEIMIKELKRILNGKYFKKALEIIVETKIYKRIPVLNKEFKRLYNHYRKVDVDTFLACAFVKNGSYVVELEDLSEDKDYLKRIVDLAIVTPKSKYDSVLLFNYGLEICQEANYVNWLLKKSKKKIRRIKKDFNLLPIQKVCDLKFKGEDILELTSNQAGNYVQTIVDNMIMKILKKEIVNEYDPLKLYAISTLREMGALPSIDDDYYYEGPKRSEYHEDEDSKYVETPITQVESNQTISRSFGNEYKKVEEITPLYTESKIDQIERKVNEYERSLRVKENQIKELERRSLEYKLDNDVNNIVGQNLEILKEMNYIDKGAEKVYLSRELKEVYRGLITNVDPKYRSLKENQNEKEGNDLKNEKKD